MSKESLKPVWAIVDICGEKLQAVRPTRQLAREWNHEHNYGLGTIVKYIPAPVAPKAPKPAPKPAAVLTDWISCETPPVRVGVYERRLDDGSFGFQAWRGNHWDSFNEVSLFGDTRPVALSRAINDLKDSGWFRSSRTGGHYRGFTTPQK